MFLIMKILQCVRKFSPDAFYMGGWETDTFPLQADGSLRKSIFGESIVFINKYLISHAFILRFVFVFHFFDDCFFFL